MTTIHLEVDEPDLVQVLAELKALALIRRIVVGKLTHAQLMALPEDERLKYYDAHGGVLNVMFENGFGLTDADIEDWHRFQDEEEGILAALSFEDALKRIYGQA